MPVTKKAIVSMFLPMALFHSAGALAQDPEDEGPLPFDAVPADAASPFGGMAITPTRIVLDAGGRGDAVTLYNSGGAPVTYRIDLVELGLNASGNYRELNEGEEASWSAAPYLRYSPRQVTLQPGERQSVRLISRAPRDLPRGELRSHLRFSSIPLVDEIGDDEGVAVGATNEGDARTVSVSVGLDFRITIPVLLRNGQPEGGAQIVAAIAAQDEDDTLLVTLSRTGDRSDYGVLKAFDPAGQEIAVLRGIAILPPARERVVKLSLAEGAVPARLVLYEELSGRQEGEVLAERDLL